MSDNDRVYFRHRADIELERARQASGKGAASAHRRLAEAYLARLACNDRLSLTADA